MKIGSYCIKLLYLNHTGKLQRQCTFHHINPYNIFKINFKILFLVKSSLCLLYRETETTETAETTETTERQREREKETEREREREREKESLYRHLIFNN